MPTVPDPLDEELAEVWALVDELGDLSLRLRRAADRAVAALRLEEPEEEK